jgi:TonB-linked SusC/RagA family outer membrane protein
MNKLLSLIILLVALTGLHPHILLAQSRTVSGKITQADDNAPLPGVNVVVKGTTTGAISDADGNYSVAAEPGATLQFTFVGFTPREVVVGDQATINVQLEAQVTELNQVVVTGYNTQQRRDVTGSIASVSAEKFKEIPVIGIDQALQGQAAGVQVTQSSGTPGGGISVRVRGSTSISASNRPLFVVDGVPVEDGQLALRSFGGQNDNALALLNPNDIDRIDVLKDANAKAAYGSRGANGVVLVTTKRGKTGKTNLSATVERGVVDPVKRLDLLNSSELLELQREAAINAGQDPNKLGLISGVTDAVNTDWLDQVLRRGIYQQYQLSASGGTDRTRFYLSGNVRDEEGVQLNNRFTRYSGTVNLDHTATPKLSFGTNLTISRSRNDRIKGDNFLDGVYSGAVKSLPYYTAYNEQGELIGPNTPGYAAFPNFNPVAQALLPRFQTFATKILGGLNATYAFTPGLRLRSQISADFNDVIEDQFESSATAIGGYLQSVGGRGYGVYSTGVYATIINTNTLSFDRTISEKHNFTGYVGTEILQRTDRTSSVQGRVFPSDDFTYITSAGIVDAGSSSLLRSGLLSAFGDLSYKFSDKYRAKFTARYDGSSRFGAGRRFGFFPSASVGWTVSSESFMERFSGFLDEMILRASYGYSGNERIGDFLFLGTFAATTYNGASGTGAAGLGNNNLQWENTREVNFGLDASFWNGRLSLTVDAYNNYTSKLLFNEPIPLTTGFGGIQGNIGNIRNRGVELTVNTVNLDGVVKWTTGLNLSRNVNEVVTLASEDPLFRGYDATGVGSTNAVLPGHPLGTFWGLNFLGVDPATGDAIYEDVNGDAVINADDAKVIGNAQPDFVGGVTNRIAWKGFDLSGFFQFSYGNQMLNYSKSALLNAGEDLNNNQVREALDRWRKPGDITHVPRYESGNTYNNQQSSRFIEDGSYLRLKNLTIGYNLPSRLINRFKVSNLRVYVSGTNLWTLTPYSGPDPEVSTLDGSTTAQGIDFFTLPQVRTVVVGLSVGI